MDHSSFEDIPRFAREWAQTVFPYVMVSEVKPFKVIDRDEQLGITLNCCAALIFVSADWTVLNYRKAALSAETRQAINYKRAPVKDTQEDGEILTLLGIEPRTIVDKYRVFDREQAQWLVVFYRE